MANIFHARCVILTMSVYSLFIAREYNKGIRDSEYRNQKNEFTFCCQIINSLESVGMEGTRGYGQAMESESNGGKRNKLYFLFGNRL